MSKRLFVGGLPWSITDKELGELFSKFGTPTSVKVIIDKFSGRSKGFGFVEFENDADADKAMKELDGSSLQERKIIVNVARPMEERSFDSKPYGRGRDDGRRSYRDRR